MAFEATAHGLARRVPAQGEAGQTGHLGDGEAGLSRSHELEGFAGTEPVSRANQAEALQAFPAHDATAAFHGEAHRARRSQAVATASVVETGLADPPANGLSATLEVTGQFGGASP